MKKNMTIAFFSLSPMANLKSLNKLPNTRVFIAAEKWMVRSSGVSGFIPTQNGKLGC